MASDVLDYPAVDNIMSPFLGRKDERRIDILNDAEIDSVSGGIGAVAAVAAFAGGAVFGAGLVIGVAAIAVYMLS